MRMSVHVHELVCVRGCSGWSRHNESLSVGWCSSGGLFKVGTNWKTSKEKHRNGRGKKKKKGRTNNLQVTELHIEPASKSAARCRRRTPAVSQSAGSCTQPRHRGLSASVPCVPGRVPGSGGDSARAHRHLLTWAPEVRASARVSPPSPRRSRTRRVRDVKCRPRGCSGQGMGWAINNHTGYTTPWTVTSPSQEKTNNI